MTHEPTATTPETTPGSAMPVGARVHLAHALVQWLADSAAVDVLHLKGPAVLPGLRDPARTSTDVDILVRPSHLTRLIDVLEANGWTPRTDFATGSPFTHAANWWHEDWGWLDLHVSWPGVRLPDEDAYDLLAQDAVAHPIAHFVCPVPNLLTQRLILLLHAARTPYGVDRTRAWDEADDAERAAVRALAKQLDAEVALAAGIGELDLHHDDRDHDLWLHFSSGNENRLSELRARLRSARGTSAKARVLTGVLRVNRDHLRMELGHEPTRREVRRQQGLRLRRTARELTRKIRRAA